MARAGIAALCLAAAVCGHTTAAELSDREYPPTTYDAHNNAHDQVRHVAGYDADYGAELAELRQRVRMLESGNVVSGAADGACDGCATCGGCGDDCCCGRSGWYFGAAAVWLKPHYKTNKAGLGHAFTVNTNLGMGGAENHVSFSTDYEVTPRLWLGYVNCNGGGWRLRYWEYDHGPATANAVVTASQSVNLGRTRIDAPGTVEALHDLTLRTLDLDVTQRFDNCWGNAITAGFGLRYARMDQLSLRQGSGSPASGREVFTSDFEGVGPTFALEVQRQVSCCWGVYGNVRHSVLFGDWNTSNLTRAIIPSPPVDATVVTTGGSEEPLQITEVEIGLEWRRPLAANVLYVRGGYEGQLWHAAGGPFNQSLDLGLHGFGFSAGVLR